MSSATPAKSTKKSAFSCEPCRRRKVKCGGEQPVCQRCASRKDECIYKLNPTLSYTQRLETRITELEEQLAAALKSAAPAAAAAPSSQSSPSTVSTSLHDGKSPSKSLSDDQGLSRSFTGLKVDDRGRITYHGATSFFNLPNDHHPTSIDAQASSDMDHERRERLVSNAWQQRALENLSGTPEPFQYLINVHWCWIQPLFNFIYRPAFTRDMQLMGSYYSHMLLNAMISHSIRWGKNDPTIRGLLEESYDRGAVFGKHARSMLFEDLNKGACAVPTVQTLLLLSAQECSFGNSTQAWTYSGLAFRLMDHIGICLDGERYPGSVSLTDEDIEIRRRVFWSGYFWDKMISLYLGRSPSLQLSASSPPQIMFDNSAEDELWVPFGMPPDGQAWNYPPATAHSASCFMSMCRLSLIFNEILIHMYDPILQNTESEMQECLQEQEPALLQWWDELPHFLKLEPSDLPPRAPPSHIITMNCLFHTFKILLYRPMLTRQHKPGSDGQYPAHTQLVGCVTSATAIIAIFDLFCRTFSTNYCILSLAYCVYIAASIFLLQIQAAPDDIQALRRLEFCMQGLQQVGSFSPVIDSAVNFLTKELGAVGISWNGATGKLVQAANLTNPAPGSESAFQGSSQQYHVPPGSQGNALFYSTIGDDMGSEPVNPNVYQAMSSLEPLSVRVGAIHESGNAGFMR